jgi:parvulin-like peptidyl-prolyl isomerase
VQISSRFSVLGRPIPTALSPELASLAFALKVDQTHAVPLPTSQGSVVIQLKEKELATRKEFEEDKTARMRQLSRIKADEALTQYVARLRKAASEHITMDKALLDALSENSEAEDDPES